LCLIFFYVYISINLLLLYSKMIDYAMILSTAMEHDLVTDNLLLAEF
jgi:hypothetical protein